MCSQASICSISDEEGLEYSDFEREMKKLLTPTPADLKREVTNEQLAELCLKRKVKVRMQMWNPVYDYVRMFRKQGRLQNKTSKGILKLLAKAVNRHKATHCYTNEEINEFRAKDWQYRKKYNLLLLNQWAYEREQSEKQKQLSELQLTVANDLNYIQKEKCNVDHSAIDDRDLADKHNNNLTNSLAHDVDEAASLKNKPSHTNSNDLENLLQNSLNECNTECLSMVMLINTESMSIGTEDLVPSESLPSLDKASEILAIEKDHTSDQSEDVAANIEVVHSGQIEYADFNQFIPLTSTQTQHQTQTQTQSSQIDVVD